MLQFRISWKIRGILEQRGSKTLETRDYCFEFNRWKYFGYNKVAIFGESYILYFHHNISNLRSSWRLHRVRENETRLYQKTPPEIKEYIYLTLKNVVKRRDILYHHSYCKYGSRDFQNKEFNSRFFPTKGTILYWNKLKVFRPRVFCENSSWN